MPLPDNFYLGTSSWSAESWVGHFYPAGCPPSEYLPHYAGRFRSVEIDATWYSIPAPRTVDAWRDRTPEGFVFSAKIPKPITHEKVMRDCEEELELFLGVMRRLGSRLGPLVFQFPYFRKAEYPTEAPFLERLREFLPLLPEDIRFALEIRNKGWLGPELLDLLHQYRVALVWIDHPYMLTARQWQRLSRGVTTDFLYVRWLGDRYGIEEVTTTWNTIVRDRSRETAIWTEILTDLTPRLGRVYAYYNNHYAGCGYQSAFQFEDAWDRGERATARGGG